jgi:hypothetical protein
VGTLFLAWGFYYLSPCASPALYILPTGGLNMDEKFDYKNWDGKWESLDERRKKSFPNQEFLDRFHGGISDLSIRKIHEKEQGQP